MRLIVLGTILLLASATVPLLNNEYATDQKSTQTWKPKQVLVIKIAGYIVVFCSFFLKGPTLVNVLFDHHRVKPIRFRVLFGQALLNVSMASFCLYSHSPFYRFGQHLVLLTINTLLIIACIVYPAEGKNRLNFFLGLQILIILTIIFFLEDCALFILEICPYVTILSVLSFKLPHIYDLFTTKSSAPTSMNTIFLAIGMNTTRIIGFVAEQVKDKRPYLGNICPLLCNLCIVFLYYFYVDIQEEESPAQLEVEPQPANETNYIKISRLGW